MNDDQIKEVMRLADVIENLAWSAGKTEQYHDEPTDYAEKLPAARAELEAHLRTIGEPAGYSLPAGSIGAKKFAQVGGGFTPVGLVFSRGESAMAITEHGRVYWDRDLVHPISGEPESVNAELLGAIEKDRDAADSMAKDLANLCVEHERRFEFLHSTNMDASGYEWGIYRVKWDSGRAADVLQTLSDLSDLDAAIARAESAMPFWPDHSSAISDPLFHQARGIMGTENFGQEEGLRLAILHVLNARAESAIETPAKVSPCAGHAVQQEADEAGGA